jgi:hypothetical protein
MKFCYDREMRRDVSHVHCCCCRKLGNRFRSFAQEPPANANDPSSPRYGAVHDCSTEVEKWSDRDWETTKSARYGACMTTHGQVQ